MKSIHFYVCGGHLKKSKKRLIFDAICKVLSQVTSVCKKQSACAWGRLKLPSAPSPFSREVLVGVRSVARTPQPIRGCPARWQSNSNQVSSLYELSGHLLTCYRVRATARASVSTYRENGDGADGSSKRPEARPLDFFFHTEVTYWESFSDARLYGIENELLFFTLLST